MGNSVFVTLVDSFLIQAAVKIDLLMWSSIFFLIELFDNVIEFDFIYAMFFNEFCFPVHLIFYCLPQMMKKKKEQEEEEDEEVVCIHFDLHKLYEMKTVFDPVSTLFIFSLFWYLPGSCHKVVVRVFLPQNVCIFSNVIMNFDF